MKALYQNQRSVLFCLKHVRRLEKAIKKIHALPFWRFSQRARALEADLVSELLFWKNEYRFRKNDVFEASAEEWKILPLEKGSNP